jgi:septal ring-binding cell division protein DamX
VSTSDEHVLLTADTGPSAEVVFRRAVSQMACIKVARSVLSLRPNASGIDVADAVALELGKVWPTVGTKKRNGNAIIRWTVWLEPHLIDHTESGEAAQRVAYAISDEVQKGRPDSYRAMNRDQLQSMAEAGFTIQEMATQFKVSTATIQNWLKAHGIQRVLKTRKRRERKAKEFDAFCIDDGQLDLGLRAEEQPKRKLRTKKDSEQG